ncbi:hypothetical protein [Microvirga alba]|uniref:Uncharacterized protein n=1 Tax=Microvirga alba TaxID=2791025 RepID=A0A931FSR7_9HYPH|nr:hypothetical protein [Microvirga alba]MBF9233961.1 hypothetical protein [Microvirga alba]
MADVKHTPSPAPLTYKVRGDGSIFLTAGDPVKGAHRAFDIYCDERDAEFITRACNAHCGMLEAAKKALNFIENTESELGEKLSSGAALRAAITKAEARAMIEAAKGGEK